jgi:phosphohistidine phosphatase
MMERDMKLYLVRHGDASSLSIDDKRPLSEIGIAEVRQMAKFLAQNSVSVNQIYHSGKLRAEQTAALLAEEIAPSPSVESFPGLMPEDDIKPISLYCNHWQKNMMLVGHLPFMGKLFSELLSEIEEREFAQFQTATIACLEKVAAFRWSLMWFVSPKLLK